MSGTRGGWAVMWAAAAWHCDRRVQQQLQEVGPSLRGGLACWGNAPGGKNAHLRLRRHAGLGLRKPPLGWRRLLLWLLLGRRRAAGRWRVRTILPVRTARGRPVAAVGAAVGARRGRRAALPPGGRRAVVALQASTSKNLSLKTRQA